MVMRLADSEEVGDKITGPTCIGLADQEVPFPLFFNVK